MDRSTVNINGKEFEIVRSTARKELTKDVVSSWPDYLDFCQERSVIELAMHLRENGLIKETVQEQEDGTVIITSEIQTIKEKKFGI